MDTILVQLQRCGPKFKEKLAVPYLDFYFWCNTFLPWRIAEDASTSLCGRRLPASLTEAHSSKAKTSSEAKAWLRIWASDAEVQPSLQELRYLGIFGIAYFKVKNNIYKPIYANILQIELLSSKNQTHLFVFTGKMMQKCFIPNVF